MCMAQLTTEMNAYDVESDLDASHLPCEGHHLVARSRRVKAGHHVPSRIFFFFFNTHRQEAAPKIEYF